MALGSRPTAYWLAGAAMTLILSLPVVGQESLLPPGFDAPPPPRPGPTNPAPSPGPSPSPAPRPSSSGNTGGSPSSGGSSPDAPSPSPSPRPSSSSGGSSSPARPAGGAFGSAIPGALPGTIPGATPGPLLGPDGEPLPPPPPRYDLPPGSRRTLDRVGPLSAETGGLPTNAFGNRGQYLTKLMDSLRAPIVSRWGSILLRRALLSGVDTPPTVNGADFTAARAWLLLRQGESDGARMLVQSVDIDRASPRLKQVALQTYLGAADPGGACPYVPTMAGRGEPTWDLAQAMCASMVGESGTANAVLERVRRRGHLPRIDVKLAEKVVGAGRDSRRAAIVRWDNVDQLTSWRFGLATTTGVEIPNDLWRTATPAMRSWAVQAPMIGVDQRVAFAEGAAARGVISARAYVDLVSYAAAQEEPADATDDLARTVRTAFVAADLNARVAAIIGLGARNYGGKILAARAAARVSPVDLDDEQAGELLAAMMAGGLDRNAMAWAPKIGVGSRGWALLAVGSPRPLVGVDSGTVDDFNGDDDSAGELRTRFLAAALIGLGRVDADEAGKLAEDYELRLNTQTRWTRAITEAANRNESGTVALLAAVGLQGASWADVPAYHLYHITAALRRVGLGAEARMIAAEALTRV